MTHTYHITGMTCEGCRTKVQKLLGQVEGVTTVAIDLGKGEATIGMGKHVATNALQAALKDYPKYQLSEAVVEMPAMADETETRSWLATYKPILLIFGYISFVAFAAGSGSVMGAAAAREAAMRVFMSGFFLTFSFFKLLDLKGFAESYSTYDLVARRWSGWGYVYAFIELGLGISFALNLQPLLTNWVTLIVMGISIIGVLQSVLNKRKIRCACLGAVFNLPMSTVTIVEDAVMIGMSAATLVMLQ